MDFPKNLHHAYIIEGDIESSRRDLLLYLEHAFNIKLGNPDLFMFSNESFGVEDAKAIIEANLRKPVSSTSEKSAGKKFLVGDFSAISMQAQNSLLKTLEEPYPGTHIFLVTPTASVFLPTVLSRVHVISCSGSGSISVPRPGFDPKALAKKFLSSSPAERIEMIKNIMAEKENEKIADSDVEKLAGEIEIQAHAHFFYKGISKNPEGMAPFLVVDEYLRDTSSSLKMLLEYLALLLPRV